MRNQISQTFIAKALREKSLRNWAEFKKQNNLKLKKEEFESLLKNEEGRQRTVRYRRIDNKATDKLNHPNRYLNALKSKKYALGYLDNNSISFSSAIQRRYIASWGEKSTLIKFKKHKLYFRITWNEETDWDYYSKSYGRPKNYYSDRRVEMLKVDPFGETKVIGTYNLDTFQGNFLIPAIASLLNVAKIDVPKQLKKVQLVDFYTIKLCKKIGEIEIYERYFADLFVDYCILKDKVAYHSEIFEDLIPGLRKKINAKIAKETEVLTKQIGFALGFCETGMRNFCADNNLDFNGSYTRKELRNIVIQNRSLNCAKYANELRKVGILLNCR